MKHSLQDQTSEKYLLVEKNYLKTDILQEKTINFFNIKIILVVFKFIKILQDKNSIGFKNNKLCKISSIELQLENVEQKRKMLQLFWCRNAFFGINLNLTFFVNNFLVLYKLQLIKNKYERESVFPDEEIETKID